MILAGALLLYIFPVCLSVLFCGFWLFLWLCSLFCLWFASFFLFSYRSGFLVGSDMDGAAILGDVAQAQIKQKDEEIQDLEKQVDEFYLKIWGSG